MAFHKISTKSYAAFSYFPSFVFFDKHLIGEGSCQGGIGMLVGILLCNILDFIALILVRGALIGGCVGFAFQDYTIHQAVHVLITHHIRFNTVTHYKFLIWIDFLRRNLEAKNFSLYATKYF